MYRGPAKFLQIHYSAWHRKVTLMRRNISIMRLFLTVLAVHYKGPTIDGAQRRKWLGELKPTSGWLKPNSGYELHIGGVETHFRGAKPTSRGAETAANMLRPISRVIGAHNKGAEFPS
jgi:hypothetical protein